MTSTAETLLATQIDPPVDIRHTFGAWCWCQPRIERELNLDGEECEIIVHRRFFDKEDE